MAQVIDLHGPDPVWGAIIRDELEGPLGYLVCCWLAMAVTSEEARDAIACRQTSLDLVRAAGGLPPEDASPPREGEAEELLARLFCLRGPLRDLVQTNTAMVRDDPAPARQYFALLKAAGWTP